MRMATEIWDLYDAQGNRTGRTMRRNDPIPAGLYHLGVHIWPINSKGEFLIQQRASTVQWKPGMWSVTGGCAISGEDDLQAALRELSEELGYNARVEELHRIAYLRKSNAFCAVFALHTELPADAFSLQREEVEAVAWCDREEMERMIAKNLLYNYGNAYYQMLFDYQRRASQNPRAWETIK